MESQSVFQGETQAKFFSIEIASQQIVRLPASVVEVHARVLYGVPEPLRQHLQPILGAVDGGEGQKVASYLINDNRVTDYLDLILNISLTGWVSILDTVSKDTEDTALSSILSVS